MLTIMLVAVICRGLSSVFRTRAGNQETLAEVLSAATTAASTDGDAAAAAAVVADGAALFIGGNGSNGSGGGLVTDELTSSRDQTLRHLISDDPRTLKNNVHWLEDVGMAEPLDTSGPSRYVAYYDAASLYPSSGTEQKTKQNKNKTKQNKNKNNF